MNSSPEQQKATPKRRLTRSKGTVEDLARVLWFAVTEVRHVLEAQDEPLMKLKAAHALATVAGSYTKALEVAELEARILALEAKTGGLK
jgi:hypothetical protein